MKLIRKKKLKICQYTFDVVWDKTHNGASFDFSDMTMNIGVKDGIDKEIFTLLLHELTEMVAIVLSIRYHRPDCRDDYLFAYDHRQHASMCSMVGGLILEFVA